MNDTAELKLTLKNKIVSKLEPTLKSCSLNIAPADCGMNELCVALFTDSEVELWNSTQDPDLDLGLVVIWLTDCFPTARSIKEETSNIKVTIYPYQDNTRDSYTIFVEEWFIYTDEFKSILQHAVKLRNATDKKDSELIKQTWSIMKHNIETIIALEDLD